MTKEEANKILSEARKQYQPIVGFPKACDKKGGFKFFYDRIRSIADYCGWNSSYLVGGCANGFSCFELAKMGAPVLGVDNGSGRHCGNWKEVAEATRVFYSYDPSNPRFIEGKFPEFYDTFQMHPEWVVMLMVLHNMLKSMKITDVLEMIDRIYDIVQHGFIMTTRTAQWGLSAEKIPAFITSYTKFEKYEQVPGFEGKKFGLPIWAFLK
jgi:hypothetical protein